jgi:hypothetical protein
MTELVSLLDLDQIISGILDDNEPTITREIAPAERLGDTSPPKEQKSFWNRGIRVAYTDNVSYEWDTVGARNRHAVKRSVERLVEEEINIPTIATDAYTVDLETAKRDAAAGKAQLHETVDNRTRKRLADLGYI